MVRCPTALLSINDNGPQSHSKNNLTLPVKKQADSGLPAGWVVRHSNSKNLPYYFNTETKDSRWEPPSDTDMEKLKVYMAKHHSGPANHYNGAEANEGKIRASHLLVKHKDSRRPSSWKEAEITRTKEEAVEILKGHEERIRQYDVNLGDIAVSESDCSSARKKGDLLVQITFFHKKRGWIADLDKVDSLAVERCRKNLRRQLLLFSRVKSVAL